MQEKNQSNGEKYNEFEWNLMKLSKSGLLINNMDGNLRQSSHKYIEPTVFLKV